MKNEEVKLSIFGAQGYALGAYEAMTALCPQRPVRFFLVSKIGYNANTLRGVPVREIADVAGEISPDERRKIEVIISTPENVQTEIEEILEDFGFTNHQRMTSARWDEMMKLYHTKLGRFRPLSTLPIGNMLPFIRIFMAKHEKDSTLNVEYEIPEYVVPIQVGAAISKTRIASVRDDIGDNISNRNVNYSELSALYWIWKNKLGNIDRTDVGRQYYGLMQYRRIFDLSDDDMLRLMDNDVDVLLPYPMPYDPNINEHHKRWIKDSDWDVMLAALRELHPDYADYFQEVLSQEFLYNYNLILAKKAVLFDYCDWLFPVLMRTEELSDPKGDERADRYIGYMGETLLTLYFMKNSERLNIVHIGCRLLT